MWAPREPWEIFFLFSISTDPEIELQLKIYKYNILIIIDNYVITNIINEYQIYFSFQSKVCIKKLKNVKIKENLFRTITMD